MTNKGKYNAEKEIDNVKKKYLELNKEFDGLVNSKASLTDSKIIGFITNAATTIEIVMKYIIVNEGEANAMNIISGKYVSAADMEGDIWKHLPKEEKIHLKSLFKLRNLVAHDNEIGNFNENELSVAKSNLNSFVEWFFKDYLHYKLPEFSKSSYADGSVSDQPVNEKDADGFGQVRALQDWAKKEGMETRKQERGIRMLRLIAILCIPVILYFGYRYFAKASAKLNTPEQVYTFMTNYSNRINSANFDAKEFFAESVSQFITQQNVTPERINQIVQENTDYIDSKTIIDRESVHLVRKEGHITYWEYNVQFMCYRKSLNKFQSCKVEVEIGLSDANKIVSYKELNVRDLRFSDKKMN